MVHLRSYVKHSTRCFIRYADSSQKNLTASRFFNPSLLGVWIPEETLLVVFDLLLETRVRVFIWYPNTGIEKKKTHERHNQGIKADFEVRVSDIQSSLTKVSFISSSSYATCTSPIMHLICPPKFCISIVFNFSWDGCNTQEKWKTKVMQNFGGQIRCIMGVSNWRMDNYNEYEKTKIKTSCKPLPMYT